MTNVSVKTDGNTIIITIDATQDLGPSKSGKTTMVASTNGNIVVETPSGAVTLGVNAYKPRH